MPTWGFKVIEQNFLKTRNTRTHFRRNNFKKTCRHFKNQQFDLRYVNFFNFSIVSELENWLRCIAGWLLRDAYCLLWKSNRSICCWDVFLFGYSETLIVYCENRIGKFVTKMYCWLVTTRFLLFIAITCYQLNISTYLTAYSVQKD